ncbi:MAG: metal-dependent hydrolase, partial [Candidatus Heimdallarchaeaceae archaeon]
MTYTPTHLALQSLIVWLLLSKKNKSYYKEHRWEFIIISLFAMFPDIDLFFGTHRSYTHSLIIPTFVILSMLVIEKVHKDASPLESPTRRMIRFVKLAALMWLIHIFLDLSWGPLLLFWPVDPNLYDLSIYLRFENASWLFFPLTFVGIIPNWTIYSQTEGQNIYFINLSQEQRQAIYG